MPPMKPDLIEMPGIGKTFAKDFALHPEFAPPIGPAGLFVPVNPSCAMICLFKRTLRKKIPPSRGAGPAPLVSA